MGGYIDTVELDMHVREWFGLCRGVRRRRNAVGGSAKSRNTWVVGREGIALLL